MKLNVTILRSTFGDCTAGGVTSVGSSIQLDVDGNGGSDMDYRKPDDLVLAIEWNPIRSDGSAAAAPGYLVVASPAFVEKFTGVRRCETVRVRAYPRGRREPGMFGGNFVHTNDSRFPFKSPIPVFDRYE